MPDLGRPAAPPARRPDGDPPADHHGLRVELDRHRFHRQPHTTDASGAATAGDGIVDMSSLFADGALTSEATTVDCTLENGSETTCYQLEVASLASTVDTEGPYCPATTSDVGGIWVWDGDEPGLYALDSDFWDLVSSQGYEFADADGDDHHHRPGRGCCLVLDHGELLPGGHCRRLLPPAGPDPDHSRAARHAHRPVDHLAGGAGPGRRHHLRRRAVGG